jgi:hypothetical protein
MARRGAAVRRGAAMGLARRARVKVLLAVAMVEMVVGLIVK